MLGAMAKMRRDVQLCGLRLRAFKLTRDQLVKLADDTFFLGRGYRAEEWRARVEREVREHSMYVWGVRVQLREVTP